MLIVTAAAAAAAASVCSHPTSLFECNYDDDDVELAAAIDFFAPCLLLI